MNTSYLSLTVSMSQTTTPMSSFYSIQDGNYEIIDAFASNTAASIAYNLSTIGTLSSNVTTLESALSSVETQLSGVYALTGTVTLYSASWNASVYTLAMPVLKLNDSVFFKPLTASDQSLLEAAHCFTSASVSEVTFTADTQPTSDISLKYTITKGEPWVSLSITETNCTHIGDNIVSTDDVTRLLFSANTDYGLPSTITVTGASYTWDKDSGVLLLSDPTGPVSVTIEAILVNYPIYGVSGLYQSSPALTRTDDAVNMSATVNSSTGLVSSNFDNAFPWNEATVETINGNKFLHMPDMWFRVGKDSSDRITDVAVSKAQGSTGDWYKVDSFYYGCYGGSVANSKLASVSGVARQGSATRDNFRTYAAANGAGYHQLDLYYKTVLQLLWYIEWANKNSQSIMRGRDPTYGNTPVNTGGTDGLSTASGYNTSTGQMRWHYIEDYIGNLQEYVEGYVGSGSTYYVTADPSKFNDTGSGMNTLAYSLPSNASYSDRCVSALGWDDNNPFLVLPKEQTGTNYTIHFCDGGLPSNEDTLYCGAYYVSDGAIFGVCFFGSVTASAFGPVRGARLLYKPAS